MTYLPSRLPMKLGPTSYCISTKEASWTLPGVAKWMLLKGATKQPLKGFKHHPLKGCWVGVGGLEDGISV